MNVNVNLKKMGHKVFDYICSAQNIQMTGCYENNDEKAQSFLTG